MTLKEQLTEAMKQAMRAQDKARLGVIRLVLAAIKQQEVDTRQEQDDIAVLAVLDKMVKQRRESIRQYTEAGRLELAEQEQFEINVIQEYLPQALSDDELAALVAEAVAATGAASVKDMGKVMAWVKPKAQGRADMGKVSSLIKASLGG
ncbi:GatB/YqeY domain-containing protein [uncultured Thiothrix sp.]|uniref:GatB/YqeY domain-containing protein n=1 Tax=uncultured Thiothrix sp. TaxID=223185 RepID=UPI00260D1EE4|nr:GatB/YqeY domain-containing protein [uncultured Thiothrix sp.]